MSKLYESIFISKVLELYRTVGPSNAFNKLQNVFTIAGTSVCLSGIKWSEQLVEINYTFNR